VSYETLTAKQERFCLLLVKGLTQTKAYEQAGYATKSIRVTEANASRLANNAKVIARIAELRAVAVQKTVISLEKLTDELLVHNAMAKELGQIAAATGALALVARLHGMLVDHKTVDITHHKPARQPTKAIELTEDEWLRLYKPKE
jgi:phage terminase small subunit